ncbi:hypothetical protein J2W14_000576 [Pseudarthrobacter oxydans]|nr:hypothetical protein [Pseudarthrobacter oxydans]
MRAATPASSPRALPCTTVRPMNDPDAGPDLRSGPASGISGRPRRPGGHAQPAVPPVDRVPLCPRPGANTGHVPRPERLQRPMLPWLTNPQLGHAQPAVPRVDIVPPCPRPGANTGHVPRAHNHSAQRLDTSPGSPFPRRKDWTCPTAHQPPDRACPTCAANSGHSAHMPTLRRENWACPPGGRGENSAFMLFSIDKATDSKIKSINSTTCDGYH